MVLLDLLQERVVRTQGLGRRRVEEAVLDQRVPLLGGDDRVQSSAQRLRRRSALHQVLQASDLKQEHPVLDLEPVLAGLVEYLKSIQAPVK